MAAAATHRVDSYHINVAVGDAAVHLWVQTSGQKPKGGEVGKPYVRSAVLIDGGDWKNPGPDNVQGLLDQLPTQYDFDGGRTALDALIITHWDVDHWRGIYRLFENDVIRQVEQAKANNQAIDKTKIRFSFFKYQRNDAGVYLPQTTLYAPHWNRIGETKAYCANFTLETVGGVQMLAFEMNKGKGRKCGVTEKLHMMANVVEGDTQPLLGMEFFRGQRPADFSSLTSPEALILYAKNQYGVLDGEPGMYCVMTTGKALPLPAMTHRVRLVDESTTPTNRMSIGAMIIWPTGRLSHYFAGDAGFETEDQVVKWSGTSTTGDLRVRSVKASHHGSAYSFPTSMFRNFRPDNVVISAGAANGHPRWELVLYFFAYAGWRLETALQAGQDDPNVKLYPTCFPYWFARKDKDHFILPQDKNGKPVVTSAAFDTNNTFTADFDQMYGASASSIPNPRLFYKPTDNWQLNLQWLFGRAYLYWPYCCALTGKYYPVGSFAQKVTYYGTSSVASTPRQSVSCVQILSSLGADDGQAKTFPEPASGASIKSTRATNKDLTVSGPIPPDLPFFQEGLVWIEDLQEFVEAEPDVDEADPEDITTSFEKVANRIPLLPLPPATPVVLPAQGDFYCSQRIGITDPRAHYPTDPNMRAFLSSLHLGWIGVDTWPLVGVEANVLPDDEWGGWLNIAIAASAIKISGDAYTIAGIDLHLSFVGKDLVFSTDNVPWAFDLPGAVAPGSGPTSPPPPALYTNDTLILALGLNQDILGINLSDLCTALGIKNPVFGSSGAIELPLKIAATAPSTAEGHRNALWFMPTQNYKTILRMAFEVTVVDGLNSAIFTAIGLNVTDAEVIVRSTASFAIITTNGLINTESELIFTTSIGFASAPDGAAAFSAAIEYNFADGSTLIVLQCAADPTQWQHYLDWVENKMKIPTGIANLLPTDWLTKCVPKRVQLTLDSNLSTSGLELDFEIDSAFGQGVTFLFTFSWTLSTTELSASLWPGPPSTSILPTTMTPSMYPDYEDYRNFQPSASAANYYIALADLLPDNVTLKVPNGIIPDVIVELNFDVSRQKVSPTSTETSIQLNASLTAGDPGGPSVPAVYLDALIMRLQYTFESKVIDLAFEFVIDLDARASSKYEPALLDGAVNYWNSGLDGQSSASWQLEAYVQDLKVGNIVSLFESTDQDGVMDLIEHIDIRKLGLYYDYDPNGLGNHFLAEGVLLFGEMELTLQFEHYPSSWTFTADLVAPDANETVNSVLAYISNDITLPSFIGNINLASDSSFDFSVRKAPVTINGVTTDYIVLQLNLQLGDFDVLFMQYNTSGWKRPKRIFRASVQGLSDMTNVPVLDDLKQPYDELIFLYVQDKSGQTNSGILRQEADLLQGDPAKPVTPAFLWKETKPVPKQTLTDTIYAVGPHFEVVAIQNGQPVVVLDHVFGDGNQSPSPTPGFKHAIHAQDLDPDPDSPSPSDTSMASMKKTFGPLTISNIGIQLKDGHMYILLDAEFALGPITLDLLGFGIDLDFSQAGASLKKLPSANPMLNGLGFGYSSPPVEVAGLFEKQDQNGSVLFLGGVVVTFDPWLFMAAGCYGTITVGNTSYKTVALFCLLEGPLIELEFAEIDGICGGFGYNSNLRFPTIDTVSSYPFVAHTGIGATPLDTIKNLLDPTTGCISAQNGSIWLAAGLNVDAFKILNVNAVLVVEFSNSDVKIGIFADAIAIFPADPEDFKLLHVELGLVATVDVGEGTMLIQGNLVPNSFILDPACNLSGGFALGYWFGSNQHAGDWVFTIGGYHPSFQPPSYYPSVPRLAISWGLDSSLNITGEAYFAITPKICMGGGKLSASLSLDPLYAYFDAFADFLIKFQPFYFIGDVGVDVGVRFTLDLWIVTIYINIDISAELYIQGPPVHGYVHVDFWVFGFDIYFGNQEDGADPVDLVGFYNLLQQQAQVVPTVAGKPTDPNDPIYPAQGDNVVDSGFKVNCTGGLVNTVNDSWNVRAGSFEFRVSSPFAMGNANIEEGASTEGSGQAIYARPMQTQGELQSVLTAKVTMFEEGIEKVVADFRIQKNISRVAKTMWGQYNDAEDPIKSGNFAGTLLNNNDLSLTTIPHMMSVSVITPKPYWPDSTTEPLAPFKVVDAAKLDIFFTADPVQTGLNTASSAWSPVLPPDATEATEVPAIWGSQLGQDDLVKSWIGAMAALGEGWDQSPALNGHGPTDLLKGFDAYFMSTPLMTAASA